MSDTRFLEPETAIEPKISRLPAGSHPPRTFTPLIGLPYCWKERISASLPDFPPTRRSLTRAQPSKFVPDPRGRRAEKVCKFPRVISMFGDDTGLMC